MLDGKRFLPETGTPIRNTACIRRPFALAEPVPLTFASLTAKSFTRVRKSLCTIDDLVVIVRIAGISSLHSLVLIGRATFHLTTWMRENARMPSRTLAVLGLILAAHVAIAAERRIDVKVVVVAMFERGADIGDQPGEYQAAKASRAARRGLGGAGETGPRISIAAGLSRSPDEPER